MSRMPPKKTDMGKAWMKPRRDSRQMIFPEYHLIVSEGTKTEPKYFEKIRETIDVSTVIASIWISWAEAITR